MPTALPLIPPPTRTRNRQGGLYARTPSSPLTRESIVHRASLLPGHIRALLTAYYELNLPLKELALLHKMPLSRLRRLILHWRDVLSDPDFLIAARFVEDLPSDLASLARAYFLQGKTLRHLAAVHHSNIHQIRKRITQIRLELIRAAARHHAGTYEGASNDH